MWFGIISLFPEMFTALHSGITGRAIKERLIELSIWNPRDFATDKHQTVDDRPYGGGPGMVMMTGPLQAALNQAKQKAPSPPTVIYLSPQGKPFTQSDAAEFAQQPSLILLAGRYEGIDERIIEQEIDEEWSIGDYILTGGELPAMVMIDAITRLVPEVVGDPDSIDQDSLANGLLKYPQYTRPEEVAGKKVPQFLLSGNHAFIARQRLKKALGNTWIKRPDLLARRQLTEIEELLLKEFIQEFLNERK